LASELARKYDPAMIASVMSQSIQPASAPEPGVGVVTGAVVVIAVCAKSPKPESNKRIASIEEFPVTGTIVRQKMK
jgi:hypothetical protein